jgi:uncharacterized protein (DUF2336 family)
VSETIFVTKYALTSGILQRPLDHCDRENERYVWVKDANALNGSMMFAGHDWHRDEASAKARAEEMRKSKIASLRKQLAALEKLTF